MSPKKIISIEIINLFRYSPVRYRNLRFPFWFYLFEQYALLSVFFSENCVPCVALPAFVVSSFSKHFASFWFSVVVFIYGLIFTLRFDVLIRKAAIKSPIIHRKIYWNHEDSNNPAYSFVTTTLSKWLLRIVDKIILYNAVL